MAWVTLGCAADNAVGACAADGSVHAWEQRRLRSSVTMVLVPTIAESVTRRDRRRLRLLPIAFLLAGSALAVAFGAVDLGIGAALIVDGPSVLGIVGVVLLVLLLPTLAALIPAMRHLEGVAAITLLDVDLGGDPVPSRTGSQRLRTIGWFWLHLLTGAAVAAALMFGVVLGIMVIVQTLTLPVDGRILEVGWAVRSGWPADLGWLAVGVAMIVIAGVAILACAWLVTALASSLLGPTPQERIAALDARTTRLVERTRLARELHDSVGHALSVIVLQSAVAGRRARTDPEAAVEASAAAEHAARTALTELDDVLGVLREDAETGRHPVRDLTAVPELIKVVSTVGQPIELRSGDDLEVLADGLPAVISREAYRIVQEGITNALKHAPQAPVTIELERSSRQLSMMISNPIDLDRSRRRDRRRTGHGLTGLTERVKLLGGEFDAGRNGDDAWQLLAKIPLPRQDGRP